MRLPRGYDLAEEAAVEHARGRSECRREHRGAGRRLPHEPGRHHERDTDREVVENEEQVPGPSSGSSLRS